MQIIAHRGYWIHESEKNSLIAFERALEHGFGIETDLRDFKGRLVVSHDVPVDNVMKIEEFIDLNKKIPISAPIALNIKSDGLYYLVKDLIVLSGITNYFVFDMSVPDTMGYLAEKVPVYTRLSEHETAPAYFEQSRGIWLDAFDSEWYDSSVIIKLLECNKEVSVVSPELHRRPHFKLWNFLKENNFHHNSNISICTDYPLMAKEYFNA